MTSTAPIAAGALPADVRNGSREDRATYDAALSFERILLGQLTASLQRTTGADEDEQSSPYASLIPETLADAVTADGGLGLADDLYRSLRQGAAR